MIFPTALLAVLPCTPQVPITISFEDIPGIVAMTPNIPGLVVPEAARLSSQLQASTGAVFRSESGEPFVSVVEAPPVPSEVTAIGGADLGGVLDYNTAVIVEFFVPGCASTKAVTSFVSITTDLQAIEPLTGAIEALTLMAFDVDGVLLGIDSTFDLAPGGFTLSVATPGIHAVRLVEDGSTNAWDDLTFAPVSAAPVVAVEVVRLGSPPNPNVLLPGQTSGPVIGMSWDPIIDHASFMPASLVDVLVVTASPTQVPLGSLGTLLCDLSSTLVQLTGPPGIPFSVPIPASCSLAGVSLCAQGASVDLAEVMLTNALDLTLGSS